MPRCMVQVEFFHTIKEPGQTMDEMMHEVFVRMCEGSNIKTAVRFYDSGELLDVARKFELAQKELQHALNLPKPANVISGKLHYYRIGRKADQVSEYKHKATPLVRARLKAIAKNKEPLAQEGEGHKFYLVQPHALHEVVESVIHCPHNWVFMFEPVDLCSDGANMLGHIV